MATGSPDPATIGPLARKVLAYGECIERTVKQAKQPGFTAAGWGELTGFIAVDKFERVGNYMERMNWPQYVEMLTQWAAATDFWSRFRRITEVGNLVFLELEEHNKPRVDSEFWREKFRTIAEAARIDPGAVRGDAESVVNSLTLYEFDANGKLCHLDIYLQIPN